MTTWILIIAVVLGAGTAQDVLDIRLPPSIIAENAKKVTYRSDDSKTLECVADGYPKPEYKWLKNEASLDLNLPNIHPNPESGTITIDPLGSLDEGYYQCVASNLYGKALSNVVFLQRAVLTSYPPQDNPTVYDAEEGQAAMIRCESTESVPTPTYAWSIVKSMSDLVPQDLQLDDRVNTDTEGNLHFANTLRSDNRIDKIYRCSVFNSFTATTVHGSYSQLKVAGSAGGNIKPSRSFSPVTPTIALVKKDLVLKCLFAGNPTPIISWRREGSSLPIGRHNIRNYDTELVISPVEYSDEDTYYCKGTNSAGNDEVAIAVDVQEEPMFVDNEASVSNLFSTDGETAVFRCDANAEPIASTKWLKNGDLLEVNENPRMSLSDNDRTLTIRDVCKSCPDGSSDLMALQCNASNVHGYVFSSGFLNVLTPTVILTAPESVELVYYKDVIFKCEASSDDSTPPTVDWLRNGEQIVYQPGRMEKLDDNSLRLVTKEEDDGGASFEGQYTCVATNGYSTVNATATLNIPATSAPGCSQGCLNGNCTSPDLCVCNSGWTGADCGTDIDECASDPCQNGASCTDQSDGFRCACPAGYTGATCQTDIDDCAADPCENGATCEDRVADFFCRCAPGYDGKNCSVEIDECASGACQNGATCTCQCKDGFTGIHCETNIDECASAPCQHEGTCHDLVNGYRCECRIGITGVDCETPILDCSGVDEYPNRIGYILDPTDCRCYYRCNKLTAGAFYRYPRECCPRRMYWDDANGGCNLVWKVDTTGCIGNDTSFDFDPGYGEGSEDADPVTLPPLDPLEDCPYDEDYNFRRNYQLHSDRGGEITMPCPKDLFWNQKQCTCTDSP